MEGSPINEEGQQAERHSGHTPVGLVYPAHANALHRQLGVLQLGGFLRTPYLHDVVLLRSIQQLFVHRLYVRIMQKCWEWTKVLPVLLNVLLCDFENKWYNPSLFKPPEHVLLNILLLFNQ
ncbi:hypothetical protein D3C78_845390 [compost metagenome]